MRVIQVSLSDFPGHFALVGGAASAVYLLAAGLRSRMKETPPRLPAFLNRGLAVLGATVAIQGSQAVATPRIPLPRTGAEPPTAPPWTETEGSPSPPSPVQGAGHPSRVHPAVHPGHRSVTQPLFPRAHGAHSEERVERLRSIAAHPSGRKAPEGGSARIVVSEGDTLWGLAARILRTDDARRIDRYWRVLYAANRSVIGADPHLIVPGLVLRTPLEPGK